MCSRIAIKDVATKEGARAQKVEAFQKWKPSAAVLTTRDRTLGCHRACRRTPHTHTHTHTAVSSHTHTAHTHTHTAVSSQRAARSTGARAASCSRSRFRFPSRGVRTRRGRKSGGRASATCCCPWWRKRSCAGRSSRPCRRSSSRACRAASRVIRGRPLRRGPHAFGGGGEGGKRVIRGAQPGRGPPAFGGRGGGTDSSRSTERSQTEHILPGARAAVSGPGSTASGRRLARTVRLKSLCVRCGVRGGRLILHGWAIRNETRFRVRF